MRSSLLIAVAALFVAALAVPASAVPKPGDPDFEPTLRTEQVFFHCVSANKVQNVDQTLGTIPSWNTTAPTTSFTAGGGCGTYDNILSGGASTFTAVWEGTFQGNLDAMNIELHRLIAGAGGSITAPQLVVTLTVDGAVLYDGDVAGISYLPSSTGASEKGELNFNDLGYLTEHGDGEQTRTIRLEIDSYNEAQNAWVFDATEVPAGITFNPEKNAFPRVKV